MIDERLESAIKQTGARVLILDPIQAYLGGTMDMNRANEARDMTKRLSLLAEKYKCAILLIGHMNKAGEIKLHIEEWVRLTFCGSQERITGRKNRGRTGFKSSGSD